MLASAVGGRRLWLVAAVNVINNSERGSALQRNPELDGRLHVVELMDQVERSPLVSAAATCLLVLIRLWDLAHTRQAPTTPKTTANA